VLKSFADRLACSAFQRHLLFLTASLLTIVIIGYHFGTFDQNIHIPFLKKYADPALYPANEEFFALRRQHYSFFWFLFLPFYRLGVLEPTLFVVHVAATHLTFWAVWDLSLTLFGDPLAGLLTVLALIFPHIGFSSFPIFEFSLLNRTFVLPFLLWAMTLFLRGRHVWAFALLGVLYNLHVLSVNFVLCMFLLAAALDFRRIGWRRIGLGLGVFGLGAFPVLIWRFTSPPVRLAPNPEWFSIISRGMFYHLFYFVASFPHIWLVTLAGLSALGLFIIARRRNLSPQHDRTATIFVSAVLIILGVQIIATYLWPVTILIQSQIVRAGLLALILGYVYFAGYLAMRYRTDPPGRGDFGWLMAATVFSTLPTAPSLVLAVQRWAQPGRRVLAAVSVAGMLAATFWAAFTYDLWSPGIYIYMRPTPWHEAQVWARDNTPENAVFITPMHLWWLYDADWRVFSERSQVVTLSDLLEIALVPDYLDAWKQRFEVLAPGAMEQFRGDFFENLTLTSQAFYSLSADDFLRVARQYGASYLVVEKPHRYDWPVAYENRGFVVYRLPVAK